MLSNETLQMFAQFIYDFVQLENEIEDNREQLAKNLYAEPYTIFRRIDFKKILYLDLNDVDLFLTQNNVKEQQDLLQLVIRKIDIDKDQFISFSEFSRYILPHKNKELNQLANNRQSYQEDNNRLPNLLENQIAQVFKAEIELAKKMLMKVQILKQQKDWDKITAWEVVNQGRKWDSIGLNNFLQNFDLYQLQEDLDNFIYRNSKERDYRVNYSDFLYLIFVHEDKKQYIFQTPQKKVNHKQNQKSQQQNQTNFKTNESTNEKTDFQNKNIQSSSHHVPKKSFNPQVSDFTVEYQDQEVNFLEFLIEKIKLSQHLNIKTINQLYKNIDQENKGYFTLEDLMKYFKASFRVQPNIEQLVKLVKILDINKDGVVTWNEFQTQMIKNININQQK